MIIRKKNDLNLNTFGVKIKMSCLHRLCTVMFKKKKQPFLKKN